MKDNAFVRCNREEMRKQRRMEILRMIGWIALFASLVCLYVWANAALTHYLEIKMGLVNE